MEAAALAVRALAPEHTHPQGPDGRGSWCLTCEVHYLWGLGAHRVLDRLEPGDVQRAPASSAERIELLENYILVLPYRFGFSETDKALLRRAASAEIAEERAVADRTAAGVVGLRTYALPRPHRPTSPAP